jgi:hypothetical protein
VQIGLLNPEGSKKEKKMTTKQRVVNLGFCVARITEQPQFSPKLRLEIFSPDSSDADGRYIPRCDFTITDDMVVQLADFLENYCSNRQAAKGINEVKTP